jgi:hypothetical protein
MPDLSFLSDFAQHPLTLSILTIATIVIVFMVKVLPHMKELGLSVHKDNSETQALLKRLIESDEHQSVIISNLQSNQKNSMLDILRLTVYSTNIPIEDRLVAARRYFLLGGNGKVAHIVKPLTVQYGSEWNAILAMSTPEEKALLLKTMEDTK